MSPNIDPVRQQEWLQEFERRIEQCDQEGKHNILIDYRSVSQSFPGGSHPDRFDIFQIDWDALRFWASSHGWNVMTAPESTDSSQLSTPYVRFIRVVEN